MASSLSFSERSKWRLAAAVAWALVLVAGGARAEDDPWPILKADLFADRTITEAVGTIGEALDRANAHKARRIFV